MAQHSAHQHRDRGAIEQENPNVPEAEAENTRTTIRLKPSPLHTPLTKPLLKTKPNARRLDVWNPRADEFHNL